MKSCLENYFCHLVWDVADHLQSPKPRNPETPENFKNLPRGVCGRSTHLENCSGDRTSFHLQDLFDALPAGKRVRGRRFLRQVGGGVASLLKTERGGGVFSKDEDEVAEGRGTFFSHFRR